MSTLEPADRPHHHDHAFYEELVSGAALGILTPDEHADLMAYLDTDRGGVLRDDLADFMEVAAALPLGLDEMAVPVAPSADLRNRLQAAILAESGPTTAQVVESAASTPPGIATITPPERDEPRSIFDAGPEEIAAVAPPVSIERHPRFANNQVWMRALAAIVLVALLAGSGFTGYQLAERNRPADDGAMSIAVDFMTPMPDGTVANLQYDPNTKLLMLSTTNMPAAPADHVYQVWMIGANGPESAGMMGPDGFATMMDASSYKTLAITVEPGPSGSPGPTTDPIVVASLAGIPSS